MPINIYRYAEPENVQVAWLCDGDWELPSQTTALEAWLEDEGKGISPGEYVVDIGFSPRAEALGGGGVITRNMMKTMADIGMDLFLSEYPAEREEAPTNPST